MRLHRPSQKLADVYTSATKRPSKSTDINPLASELEWPKISLVGPRNILMTLKLPISNQAGNERKVKLSECEVGEKLF